MPPAKKAPSTDPPGWGDARWRVMMHLLKHRPTFPSARELARDVGVGRTQAAEVVSFLEFHRALRKGKAGLAVQWAHLAKVMAAFRLPMMAPRVLEPALDQPALRDRLTERRTKHVFGFTTAANALAYFEPHPETCVLVDRGDVPAVVEAVAGAVGRAMLGRGSSEAKRSPPRILLFADKLERLDTVESGIGTVTSLHQTYVDLLHFPLAAAHADFLRKAIERRWEREERDAEHDS